MQRLFFAFVLYLGLSPNLRAQAPIFDLAVRVGTPVMPGPNSVSHCLVFDVAVDGAGNSYVTGYFQQGVTFGSTTLTVPPTSADAEVFVAKIDATGQFVWAVRGNGGNSFGQGIALDAAGNIYVTGEFSNASCTFGTTLLTNAGAPGTGEEVFVAKLSPAGTWLWAVRGGGTGADRGHAIAVDAGGGVYLTGTFTSALLQIGGTSLPHAQPLTPGSPDVFVAKVSSSGAWQWAVAAGGTQDDVAGGIAADANGNLCLTGYFWGTSAAFGTTLLTNPGGGSAVFVAKLNPSGSWAWAVRGGGGTRYDAGYGIAFDHAGNVVVSGTIQNRPAVFGTTSLTNAGILNGFVAKLNAAGAWQWAVSGTGSGDVYFNSVATNAQGEIYLAGAFDMTAQLGGTTLRSTPPLGAGFPTDVLVAKLTASGAWLWAQSGGGSEYDTSYRVALDGGGRAYIGGMYASPFCTLGPLTLPGEQNFSNASGLVARLGAPPAVTIRGDSLVCNGGSTTLSAVLTGTTATYRWNTGATTATITVTQPGTYSVLATFSTGGSSTATYRVQALAPSVAIAGDTLLCPGTSVLLRAVAGPGTPSYRWSTGAATPTLAVTQSGTYTLTASYGVGCAAATSHRVRMPTLRVDAPPVLCAGTAVLTAVAPGATAFRWSTGSTSPNVVVGQPGTFTVEATFANGCALSASVSVAAPVARITGDTALCPGRAVVLTASLPGATAYRWNTGATTSAITASQPGTYQVTATFGAGCTATATQALRAVLPLPSLSMGPDTVLCDADSLRLTVPSLPAGQVTYRWSDGSSHPFLRVGRAGSYSVDVSTACEARTLSRRVEFQSCLFIPNVITPNHDGRNDVFAVRGLPRGAWAITVYNRWGRAVYHADDYRNEWGTSAAPGLYYYLLERIGQSPAYKGWVEVIP